MTHGLYIGELLRRVDGRSADRFVQEEIVAKANAVQAARGEAPVELRIGCAPEQQARVARHELVQPALFVALRLAAHALLPRRLLPLFFDELDLLPRFDLEGVVALALPQTRRSFAPFCDSPTSPAAIANDPVARSACNLSAFGVTNARALAAVLAAALDGETLLPRAALLEALAPAGPRLKCDVLCDSFTFSNAGWGLDRFEQFGLAGWVGWAGMGGSMLVMHPDSQSVFAYTVTGLDSQQHKARAVHLLQLFQRYALDPPPATATPTPRHGSGGVA
jgi:CubicO group peptidase (beta-lactamase class C family)